MQKRDGQGEAESYTKSGEEEAKGGENVQKINREDVVQAALIVERWCKANRDKGKGCDCPFYNADGKLWAQICRVSGLPEGWNLEEHLRTRGMKHG